VKLQRPTSRRARGRSTTPCTIFTSATFLARSRRWRAAATSVTRRVRFASNCSEHQAGGIQLKKRGLTNVSKDVLGNLWRAVPAGVQHRLDPRRQIIHAPLQLVHRDQVPQLEIESKT